jgi:hypothetical protein
MLSRRVLMNHWVTKSKAVRSEYSCKFFDKMYFFICVNIAILF